MRSKQRSLWERVGLDVATTKRVLRFDCDPAMELRFQALMVRRPTFFRDNADFLLPEMFASEPAELFARAVHDYVGQYRAVPDRVSAAEYVTRHPTLTPMQKQSVLLHVESVYGAALVDEEYATRVLREMGSKRALRATAMRIAGLADEQSRDPNGPAPWSDTDLVLDIIQAALALVNRSRNAPYSLREDFGLIPGVLTKQLQGIPTGITVLDAALAGGLCRGELGIIIAPPKGGKTLCMVNFARGAILAGYNVLYVTFEDGKDVILGRLGLCLLGVSKADVRAQPELVVKNLAMLLGFLHRDVHIYDAEPDVTGVGDIEAIIEELDTAKGFRPDVVILDYADKMRAPHKYEDRWMELQRLYTVVRSMGRRRNVAIWSGSQTNVQGGVAGAYGKLAEVDAAFQWRQDDKERAAGTARLHALAVRNRPTGAFLPVHINYDYHRVTSAGAFTAGPGGPPVLAAPVPGAISVPAPLAPEQGVVDASGVVPTGGGPGGSVPLA